MLLLVLLLLHTANATTAPTQQPPAAANHLVYLCGGSRSFAYHSSPRCEGLAWCTTSLRKATVGAATKQGRYPCGRCRLAR